MYNVFIIDDEPLIGEGLRKLIDWAGYDCAAWVFHKSTEAFEKALAVKPEIIIADIKMPFMNGIELISQLKAMGINSKFIILSGYSEFEYAKKGIELGVNSYLLKPVEENEVYEALEQAIRQIEKENEEKSNLRKWRSMAKMRENNLCDIPQEMLDHLANNIDCLNFTASKKIVNEIFKKIIEIRPVRPDDLRVYCISILLASVKNLSQYELRMNAALGINVLSLSDAARFDSQEKIFNWLVNIIKLIIETKEQERATKNSDIFERITKYIDAHYSDNLFLSSIADLFYLNPCYISQLFKKRTGGTFLNYLTDRRLEKAKELLLTSDLKVSEISGKIGYESVKHFSRLFQRVAGVKPADYRAGRTQNNAL